MLDVMSGGRMEFAFPLGTPMEYWSSNVNPVTARERQREALEVILKAWTQEGPVGHSGRAVAQRPRAFPGRALLTPAAADRDAA